MAEIARDGFNGNPGEDLSVSNPNWVSQPGASGVFIIGPDGSSINTTGAASTASYYRQDVNPPTTDYSVSLDITTLSMATSGPAAGVIMCAANNAITHYQARLLTAGNGEGTWQLRRIVNNTASVLATVAATYGANQLFNVKISRAGSTVSMFLDNNPTPLLGPVPGGSITAIGYPGVLGASATSARFRIDNFVVDDGQVAAQPVTASIQWTEAPDAITAAGLLEVKALAAWVENPDTQQVSGTLTVQAAAAWTEAADAHTATAKVEVRGTAAWTEAPDQHQVAARLEVVAAAAWTEAPDGVVITGQVDAPAPPVDEVTATARWTEQPDVHTIRGRLEVLALAAWTEQPDVIAVRGRAEVLASASWTEAADIWTVRGVIDTGGAPGDIDADTIPGYRMVIFEGSRRVVSFEGSRRVIPFEGSNRIVRFE